MTAKQAIEVTSEMIEALSDWLAESVETQIYPGKWEYVQIIRHLIEMQARNGHERSEITTG